MFPLFAVSISMWIVQQLSSSTYVLYKPVSFNVHPSFCMMLFIICSYLDFSFCLGHYSFSFIFKPLLQFYLGFIYVFDIPILFYSVIYYFNFQDIYLQKQSFYFLFSCLVFLLYILQNLISAVIIL